MDEAQYCAIDQRALLRQRISFHGSLWFSFLSFLFSFLLRWTFKKIEQETTRNDPKPQMDDARYYPAQKALEISREKWGKRCFFDRLKLSPPPGPGLRF